MRLISRLLPLVAATALLAGAAPAVADVGQIGQPFGASGTGAGQWVGPDFFVADPGSSKIMVGSEWSDTPQTPPFNFHIVPFDTSDGSTPAPFPSPALSQDGSVDCCQWAPNWLGAAIGPDPAGTSRYLFVARTGGTVADEIDRFDVATGTKIANMVMGANKVNNPSAVAVSPATNAATGAVKGDVYVAGFLTPGRQYVVRRYRPSSALGAPVTKVNDIAPASGTFNVPDAATSGMGIPAIAVDPTDGTVWVLDYDPAWGDGSDPTTTLFVASHFKPDGTFIGSITGLDLDPQYENANSMAVDKAGNLWFGGLSTIYEYDSSGTKLAQVGAPPAIGGTADPTQCQFSPNFAPWVIAAPDGSIYALDPGNYNILHFGTTTDTRCGGGNRPPVVGQITPSAGNSNLKDDAQTYNVAASDPDGNAVTYTWMVDGAVVPGAVSESLTTTFSSTTPHTVSVDVSDGGTPVHRELAVTIHSVPPTAALSASATSITTGGTVTFDASGSKDVDGTISGYAWDPGDGAGGFAAGGATLSHAYTRAGTFTARVRVTDSDGDTAVKSVTITVTDPVTPPPPPPPPPGGDGGGFGGQSKDTTPPSLSAKGGTLSVAKNAFTVTIGCSEACNGKVTATTATAVAARVGVAKKRVLTLGTASFSSARSATVKVKVKLGSAARKLLKKGKLRIVLTITATDAAGNVTTKKVSAVLANAKRR